MDKIIEEEKYKKKNNIPGVDGADGGDNNEYVQHTFHLKIFKLNILIINEHYDEKSCMWFFLLLAALTFSYLPFMSNR